MNVHSDNNKMFHTCDVDCIHDCACFARVQQTNKKKSTTSKQIQLNEKHKYNEKWMVQF